jgi:hypothetical protein
LVILSIIPYAIRVYEGKIRPVLTSWSLWSFIGLALLLSYRSSGADANVWPAVFGFTNPTLITIMSIWRGEKLKKPEVHDWLCFGFGVVSLLVWWFVRQSLDLSQYALYLAIVADLCAAIPTLIFFMKEPEGDRSFAWFLFAVAYFVAIFAIKDQTFANYVLPLYMTVGSLIATLLLVIPRIRCRVGLKEWI